MARQDGIGTRELIGTIDRPPADSVTLLSAFIVLLIALPSDLRLAVLGGAGAPPFIWALGMALWWCWLHAQKTDALPDVGAHPVRATEFVFLGCVLASYIAAMQRPLPPTEASQADIGLLRMIIFAAVLLITHDWVPNLSRLIVLAKRWVLAATGLAALGLAQFVTGQSLTGWISVPGLVRVQEFSSVSDRGGFVRAAGTAMNPLEYGLVLATAFPLALTFALHATGRRWWLSWLPVAAIGGALLVSGSRSALLGLLIGMVVLFPFWSRETKARMAALSVVALGVVVVTVPGLFGTMRYLFTNTSNDSSVQSRSGSYDIAVQFIGHSPLVGRGFGTYLPEYRILDNQYLSLAIELGMIGVLCFVVLVLVAAGCALRGRDLAVTPLTTALGPALAAATLAGAILTLFFDAFAFPMSAGAIFLMLGLCGAYWRLVRCDRLWPTEPLASRAVEVQRPAWA